MTKRRQRRLEHLRKTQLGNLKSKLKKESCTNKKQYNSEIEALSWGRFANDKHAMNIHYRAYFCNFCNKWHLTSKSWGKSQISEYKKKINNCIVELQH